MGRTTSRCLYRDSGSRLTTQQQGARPSPTEDHGPVNADCRPSPTEPLHGPQPAAAGRAERPLAAWTGTRGSTGPGALAVEHQVVAEQQLRQPLPGRVRSPRQSSRARTRSRAASCSTVGTVTAVGSSIRSSRASSNASRASVLTRSCGARRIFDGAAASHRAPAAVRSRARPNPVGPAS